MIEVLKQALENLKFVLCDPEGNVCWQGSYADRDVIGDALSVFDQAIAEAEQDGQCKHCTNGCVACDARFADAEKQEPVAWLTPDEREALERFNETCEDGEGYDVPKSMMKRLAEIGVIHHTSRGIYGITKFGRSMLGDTSPPQRQWVGLTDEEVKDIVWNLPYEPSQEDIRAIEAKLKEKNT